MSTKRWEFRHFLSEEEKAAPRPPHQMAEGTLSSARQATIRDRQSRNAASKAGSKAKAEGLGARVLTAGGNGKLGGS